MALRANNARTYGLFLIIRYLDKLSDSSEGKRSQIVFCVTMPKSNMIKKTIIVKEIMSMNKMILHPTNSNECVDVYSSQDIKESMGEIGESLNSIEILKN